MSSNAGPMTLSRIWREMSPEQRLAAAGALWADEDSVPQQVEAVRAIADHLRSRPQTVVRLPPDRLARHLASIRTLSESLASRVLIAYHLASQRPMLEAFLGHLGIPNEHGLIKDGVTEAPDPARLSEAVAALRAAFPPDDVRVYLLTLAAQDPDTWGALAPIAAGPSSDATGASSDARPG